MLIRKEMETSKPNKRKPSHSHSHQKSAISTSNVQTSQEGAPVFGKLIKRDRELQKFAQNVLGGSYSDYQSAMRKMGVNDQLYGVAEPTLTSKPPPLDESSKISHQLDKRDRPKKKWKDKSLPEPVDITEKKKKASVRPFKSSSRTTSLGGNAGSTSYSSLQGKHTSSVIASSEELSGVTPSVDCSLEEQKPDTHASFREKKRPKKAKKRKNSFIETKPEGTLPPAPTKPHLEISPTKSRPEALSIATAATDSSSTPDAPDTGDVHHMLQELLHPPAVSLVTPIPTPNTTQPFVFPTLPSQHHVFKTPEIITSTKTTDSDMYDLNSQYSKKHSGQTPPRSRTDSNSSCSSSSSSTTSSSSNSSSSSGSSCSSREQSPVDFSEGQQDQVVEDRDEGTQLALKRLQGIAFTDSAITPLKKTPPRFVCPMEELANLSPAKLCEPSKYLSTNAAAGSEGESSANHSDSSSVSESDTEVVQSKITGSAEHYSNVNVQRQDTSIYPHLPPNQLHHNQESKYKKKRKKSQPDSATVTLKKSKVGQSSPPGEFRTQVEKAITGSSVFEASQKSLCSASATQATDSSALLVRIPLTDLRVPDLMQQQLEKPKATVEPIVRNPTTRGTPNRRNTADMTEAEEVQGRDRYARLLADEYPGGPIHDYHGRSRGRWEREPSRDHRNYGPLSRASGRGSDHGRWDREHYRGSTEEYWQDVYYESSRESQRGRGYPRHLNERKKDSEYFMLEAKRRKKEADKIMVPGLEKAKLYMESVTYFMRHGGSIEVL